MLLPCAACLLAYLQAELLLLLLLTCALHDWMAQLCCPGQWLHVAEGQHQVQQQRLQQRRQQQLELG
jgi:hypothetical protein